MNKIRIGIIGMGRMGLTHYSIINTHPDVEVTAIADTSSMMLNMLKKLIPSLTVYEDYKDLLNSGLVDGVIVCTPSSLHHPETGELDYTKLDDYAKWFAQYMNAPHYPYAFQIWQASEDGTVSGIEGDVDINYSMVDFAK